MTTTYTGVNGGVYSNTISGPAAGEYVTEASIGIVAQGAVNLSKFIYDTVYRASFVGVAGFNGRKALRRHRSAVLSDADHTINVTQGDRFELSPTPVAVRTITLDSTTAPPERSECIELIVPGAMATGQQYLVKRDSGLLIAEFHGNTAGDAGVWCEFEYTATGWRLGANPAGGSAGGVLPGPAA